MPLPLLGRLFRLVSQHSPALRKKRRRVGALRSSRESYRTHKEEARALVEKKLSELNLHYQFTWGRVAIRNQCSRWGSCSTKGNLNFNFRILFLSEHLQDYIITHELCHLAIFDHSRSFWAKVAETIPDHALRRVELSGIAKSGSFSKKLSQGVTQGILLP